MAIWLTPHSITLNYFHRRADIGGIPAVARKANTMFDMQRPKPQAAGAQKKHAAVPSRPSCAPKLRRVRIQ
jgi:hypothetical protein